MNSALLLLAIASLAPTGEASDARGQGKPAVEATGSASVRIVRAFRLTPASLEVEVPGAQRAERAIRDRDGITRPANLVEFE